MQYSNGWGSPILLFQAFSGPSPWIRTFGFFFFPVLQIAMIPVSMGFRTAGLCHRARDRTLTELAAFASVATGTSPLFLPLAVSFMTDASGCFFAKCSVSMRRYVALKPGDCRGNALALGFDAGGCDWRG